MSLYDSLFYDILHQLMICHRTSVYFIFNLIFLIYCTPDTTFGMSLFMSISLTVIKCSLCNSKTVTSYPIAAGIPGQKEDGVHCHLEPPGPSPAQGAPGADGGEPVQQGGGHLHHRQLLQLWHHPPQAKVQHHEY